MEELSLSNRSGDLYANMNKDNLFYIQSQIKQKNKKNNSTSLQGKNLDQGISNAVSPHQ